MRISAANTSVKFTATSNKQQKATDKNPITKMGEKTNLAVATFVGGLGLGAKLMFELFDDGFVIEDLGQAADRYVKKNHKGLSENKRTLYTIGTAVSFIAVAIGGIALLYTLFKTPEINYKGNVNAFKKRKDMDVYIKGNNVEKELLTQMNTKAKTATQEEKAKLQEQYAKMQMAKNRVPDFVKNDPKFKLTP